MDFRAFVKWQQAFSMYFAACRVPAVQKCRIIRENRQKPIVKRSILLILQENWQKDGLLFYPNSSPDLVEPRGIEPLSEDQPRRVSPSAFCVLTFPLPGSHRRDSGFSSFIKSRCPQSLRQLVPCFYDAGDLRRRRLRATIAD